MIEKMLNKPDKSEMFESFISILGIYLVLLSVVSSIGDFHMLIIPEWGHYRDVFIDGIGVVDGKRLLVTQVNFSVGLIIIYTSIAFERFLYVEKINIGKYERRVLLFSSLVCVFSITYNFFLFVSPREFYILLIPSGLVLVHNVLYPSAAILAPFIILNIVIYKTFLNRV